MTYQWPSGNGAMAERIRQLYQASPGSVPLLTKSGGLGHLLDTALESPLPMCILWGDDALQLYNDAHADLVGDQHPNALGAPAARSWGQDWALLTEAWQAALRGESSLLRRCSLRIRRRGKGIATWLDMAFSPIRQDGVVAGVLLCPVDVTEQMQNEARLSEAAFHYKLSAHNHRLSEQRLQLALEASDLLGIWDWDLRESDYRQQPDFFSLVPMNMPGATPGLSLKSFTDHIHPSDRERMLAAIDHCIHHSGSLAERYRLNGIDEEVRWAFARGRCHYDDQGTPLRFPGAIMDITRQQASEEALRQSEAELRELNETLESRIQERTSALAEVYERLLAEMAKREQAQEALRQAQKMEAVGQLTGGIAHDFNNMLTGIIGGLDLIQHYIKSGRHSETQRFIEAATTSANRAAALTHRLLAFSRRQPLDLKRVDLNALIESMRELFIRTLGPHILIQPDLDHSAWAAISDENQLESALLNLVINARDAMPDGGTLRIATRNLKLEPGTRLGDLPPGQYVVLSVSDSGCGMSPKVLASAFEPFFTTKPIGQGTGLGLSMIYGFVRQSGGHVQLTSESDVGTEVSLYLPVHEGELHTEEAQVQPARSALARQGEAVLVLEDDAAVRLLVVELLAELGYEVLEAAEGAAALALLESPARIDLLVSDVGLPGMNGRQVADLARERRPDLRILFMTGYAAQAASSGFLEPGMDLISKPFTVDTLIRHVQDALGR
ncbi:ATP-binding protein [Stutzerimonas tarimensis]|uniref:histidine kinase n=1 Tax=Stutzerimonas tarimensis TaxID=1507735 RepID=A0ABV7T5V7_9GAMM